MGNNTLAGATSLVHLVQAHSAGRAFGFRGRQGHLRSGSSGRGRRDSGTTAENRARGAAMQAHGKGLVKLLKLLSCRISSKAGRRLGKVVEKGTGLVTPASAGGFDDHGNEFDTLATAVGISVEVVLAMLHMNVFLYAWA